MTYNEADALNAYMTQEGTIDGSTVDPKDHYLLMHMVSGGYLKKSGVRPIQTPTYTLTPRGRQAYVKAIQG